MRATDDEVTALLEQATVAEAEARRMWDTVTDVAEKDSARDVYRHAASTRKSLEGWMGRRALRAKFEQQRS